MFNVVGVESSRQLISNLSNQSSDLFLATSGNNFLLFNNSTFAISLVVLGIILGLVLGRRRVVSAIVCLYIVSALGALLPINILFSGEKTISFYILLGLYLLLFIFFVIAGHFSGAGFWYYNRFWMFLFGVLLVSLLIVFIFQLGPNSWLNFFPPLAVKIFSSTWYKFSATLLPLITLWLVARNNIE